MDAVNALFMSASFLPISSFFLGSLKDSLWGSSLRTGGRA
jgi:hypothetical protein